MEQWPHLNELVQCYRTDWVKDENKYGHYESIGPVQFHSQIFEGPDTDIETGTRELQFLPSTSACTWVTPYAAPFEIEVL